MNQKPSSNPRKPVKFIDTKVLIVTLSTAVTVGIWNFFSANALNQEKAQANADPTPPAADSEAQGLAPLPTLIPLYEVSAPQPGSDQATQQEQAVQPTGLRSVNAPSQVIVQKIKPVMVDSAGTAPTGNSGGNRPITKTRSSR